MEISHSFNDNGDLNILVPKDAFKPKDPPVKEPPAKDNDVNVLIKAAVADGSYVAHLENKDYNIPSTIVMEQGVELVFGRKTRFIINDNFTVFELKRDSCITNPNVCIASNKFDSAVFYLDGKERFYNSWFRAGVINPIVVNWSESHKGVGIHCYANGEGHEVSFVNFENPQLVGLRVGIKLEAIKAKKGYSWVNANRFTNVTLDDCEEMVQILSNKTVPNECSGNQFTNIQLQPSPKTKKLFTISGDCNTFDGMCWDTHLIPNSNILVDSTNSNNTKFNIPTIPVNRLSK